VLDVKNHETEKKTDRSERIFLLRIPIQLYDQAREKAASRTMSLSRFILEAIEEATRKK
jgi:predicted HicB family RNase H-like nuclease